MNSQSQNWRLLKLKKRSINFLSFLIAFKKQLYERLRSLFALSRHLTSFTFCSAKEEAKKAAIKIAEKFISIIFFSCLHSLYIFYNLKTSSFETLNNMALSVRQGFPGMT